MSAENQIARRSSDRIDESPLLSAMSTLNGITSRAESPAKLFIPSNDESCTGLSEQERSRLVSRQKKRLLAFLWDLNFSWAFLVMNLLGILGCSLVFWQVIKGTVSLDSLLMLGVGAGWSVWSILQLKQVARLLRAIVAVSPCKSTLRLIFQKQVLIGVIVDNRSFLVSMSRRIARADKSEVFVTEGEVYVDVHTGHPLILFLEDDGLIVLQRNKHLDNPGSMLDPIVIYRALREELDGEPVRKSLPKCDTNATSDERNGV